MNPVLLRVGALVAALLIASGCSAEEPPPLPSTAAAADAFFEAWSEGDMTIVAGLLAADASDEWPAERLESWWERQQRRGEIVEAAFVRDGAPEQPARAAEDDGAYDPVEVAYRVEYSSEAADDDVTLQGSLDLVYEPPPEEGGGGERWAAAWDPSLAWPGIDAAAAFEVRSRWPRRAPILDRDGRKLARGPADKRRYPFGALAGSTIGHIATVTRKTVADAPEGREIADLVGGSGLEAAFEERLAGTPARRLVVLSAAGGVLEELGREEGRPGRPLRTTLDVKVQRAAENGYGATLGGAAVVQPRTGDILALVDSSSFDPNFYVGAEELSPFNRALAGRYPPGSALKVVTAAAALDSGKLTPRSRLTGPPEYKGVRNFESGSFGTIDFATALRESVNTAFAQVAERLGGKRLTRYAEGFGFNREIEMPLAHGISQFPRPEDLGDLMWASIGQAQVLATPLQMATVAATIANNGRRMEPRISFTTPKRGDRVVSRKTARELTAMMEGVVNAGTGTGARLPGVPVAGKTGTAEVDVAGERKNHAWFIAFAPAGAPDVAVAIVAEYGGVGGQVAAPLARSILANVLPVAP